MLGEDLGGGKEALVEKVEEGFEGFSKHGLIACAKKLDMGKPVGVYAIHDRGDKEVCL